MLQNTSDTPASCATRRYHHTSGRLMAEQRAHAGAILTIDLDAIRNNYRSLCERAGVAAWAAVLKADAYGLGAAPVVPVLAADGGRHFFVAHPDEVIALPLHVPPHAEIFVLHGQPPG